MLADKTTVDGDGEVREVPGVPATISEIVPVSDQHLIFGSYASNILVELIVVSRALAAANSDRVAIIRNKTCIVKRAAGVYSLER